MAPKRAVTPPLPVIGMPTVVAGSSGGARTHLDGRLHTRRVGAH